MADRIDYYQVLGVPRNASQSEIRNAYRKLAKDHHPDRPGGSQVEFNRLQEAHDVLSDPNRRRQHDEALDLAHAADQLAGLNLDFGSLDDELSQKRQERESRGSGGPSLGERLRNRFRKDEPEYEDRGQSRGRSHQRAPQRRARWYEPHTFDPEPVSWKPGALSFIEAFLVFIVVGQLGFWAVGMGTPSFASWAPALAPLMPVLYSLAGLVTAYFAYRSAGWAGIALVFIAALVVGGSGNPLSLLQFVTVGIGILLVVIYLGNRRNRVAWRDRR